MDGLGRGAGSWQCWHGHVEMNCPGSCQLLLAAFGAAPHSPMRVFGQGSVLPGWHSHSRRVPTGSQPCSSLPLPFYIPCQSLNLNEASRMAALRQCLDEHRAGIASGRAQGLSLPISQGEGRKTQLCRNPGGHPGHPPGEPQVHTEQPLTRDTRHPTAQRDMRRDLLISTSAA